MFIIVSTAGILFIMVLILAMIGVVSVFHDCLLGLKRIIFSGNLPSFDSVRIRVGNIKVREIVCDGVLNNVFMELKVWVIMSIAHGYVVGMLVAFGYDRIFIIHSFISKASMVLDLLRGNRMGSLQVSKGSYGADDVRIISQI